MAQLTAETYAELTSVGPTPTGTARLARSYHRDVVRRLAPYIPACTPTAGLHPRAVWTATELAAGRTPDATCVEQIRAGLSQERIRPLEHVTGVPDYPLWCRTPLAELRADMLRTAGVGRPDMSATAAPEAVERVGAAVTVLRRVWPEAAVELSLLVRAVVYVDGGAFRSATLLRNYGAVFAGVGYLTSVPAAFETLLHETGHHSLYLRQAFERFITNGDDLVTHALRPDPRPLSGTLHAAHVLTRMATGLDRWYSVLDEAEVEVREEVRERRDDALTRLHATLEVLKTSARWTDPGTAYFANLLQRERELTERLNRPIPPGT
ncbi:aKG-HExxH-type peptide beta-hydroxylase [Streptomyces sp. HD]|uniref:aKG-HExxH-type peptide beta-hydroxylase n=1 Tax=Streptomyces sp. HD TaxID=3020892 RepID=UPI00232E8498|nr:HEXXH motif-containing putative peptide modification protein [Streptomyces sp. HD]MDC0772857.1 HEXXH motif-containing putative peptide modification protein [Streptomyces sp. HD]